MIEFLKPIEVNEQELGFDAIRGVPIRRHFFGEPHTMERYEHAFYIGRWWSNWQNYENWQLAGGKDATQRATDIWKQALKEYQEPSIDPRHPGRHSTPTSRSGARTNRKRRALRDYAN